MTNLELHNRLLQLAKDVQQLKEQHPELRDFLHPIDLHTQEALSGSPDRPIIPSPYRTNE